MTSMADKIKKSKLQLAFNDPFLSILALTSEFVEEPVGTMCTDGIKISYDPKFVEELTNGEVLFVMCHELLHIIFGHCYRGKELNAVAHIWNIACDMVVNRTLMERNVGKLLGIPPKGIVECPREYRDLTAEEIYKRLMSKAKKIQLPPQDNPLAGDIKEPDPNENTSEMIQKAKQNQKELLDKVSSSIKDFGKGFKDFERYVEDIRTPKLNWRVLLRKYVTSYIKDDYSWAKPNRRYQTMYMPSLSGMNPKLKTMNVYIDVSGSVSDEQVNQFMSEVKNIYNLYKLTEVKIFGFSDDLSNPLIIKDKWKNKTHFDTTYGTNIGPVVNHINKDKAKLNLIFTDGYFDHSPVDMLKGNIFWIIYDNPNCIPTKGRVSHI